MPSPGRILDDNGGSPGGLAFRLIVGAMLAWVLWSRVEWPPDRIAWAAGMALAATLLGMKVAAILLLALALARIGFAPPGMHPIQVFFEVVLHLLPGAWAGLILRDVLLLARLLPRPRGRP